MIDSLRNLVLALKRSIPAVLLLGTLGLGAASPANAQITLTISENGSGDVVFSYSGNWATSSGYDDVGGSSNAYLSSNSFSYTPSPYGATTGATSVTTPWSTSSTLTGVGTGDAFGFYVDEIYGPNNFTSGTSINGSATFSDVSLSDLGMVGGNSGTLNFGGGNVVNWSTVGASAVPEPGTYAAWFGAVALGWCVHRRRRRVAPPL